MEVLLKKSMSDRKEMSENIIASVEEPLNMYITVSNKTTLMSEILNIINGFM